MARDCTPMSPRLAPRRPPSGRHLTGKEHDRVENMRIQSIPAAILGENAYVVNATNSNQALVVDPGPGTAGPISKYIREHSLNVEAVLITHVHPDHVWDAAHFNVPVWVTAPDHYRLNDPMRWVPIAGLNWAEPWVEPREVHTLPTQTVCLTQRVPVLTIPAPGHTEGSAVFLTQIEADDHLETNVSGPLKYRPNTPGQVHPVAFSADVIFAGSVGRTDLPGGDETQMRHSLRTLANALDPNTWLLPGHGPATRWGVECETNPYVRRAMAIG